MEAQMNTPQETPKKSKKWLWLISLSILSCLCLILVMPVIAIFNDPTLLSLFKTGEPQADVNIGTYEGTTYTAPNGLFSCNFKSIMMPGWNPLLQTREDKEYGTGTVFATDDIGFQYGVDYFNSALFGGDKVVTALASPDTRAETLQGILENVLLPTRGPKAEIADQKFIEPDILFAVLLAPGGSHLMSSRNGGEAHPANSIEGYYIFTRGEWFYFVYHFQTPTFDDQVVDLDHLQSLVDKFYRGCQFEQ